MYPEWKENMGVCAAWPDGTPKWVAGAVAATAAVEMADARASAARRDLVACVSARSSAGMSPWPKVAGIIVQLGVCVHASRYVGTVFTDERLLLNDPDADDDRFTRRVGTLDATRLDGSVVMTRIMVS